MNIAYKIYEVCALKSHTEIFSGMRGSKSKKQANGSEYVISSMYQLIKLDCSCATSFAPLLTTSQLSRRRGDLPDLVHFSPSSSVRGHVSSHVIYLLLLLLLLLLLSLLFLSLLFTIGKRFSKSHLHITT